ncbi:hypothetical protein [Luteirhabdus pelagi]|uniref:hypothetical protein n=1 Tax=Luteirhabdus pelagi TaxID=2792783 RepID=UPI00193AB2D9|nr:hypothetical protein [Luteirhabdus pelagi]
MKQTQTFKVFFSILVVALTVFQSSWALPVSKVPSSDEDQFSSQQHFTAVAVVEEVAPQLSEGLEFEPLPFSNVSFTTIRLSKIASKEATHSYSLRRAFDIQHRLMVRMYPFHAFW